MTDDWEQIPCKTCAGTGWQLVGPEYADGRLCHWCGGHGKLVWMKGEKMDVLKTFGSIALQYWPVVSGVIVGGLTSLSTWDVKPFLVAVGTGLLTAIGAKPAAAAHARLARKAS